MYLYNDNRAPQSARLPVATDHRGAMADWIDSEKLLCHLKGDEHERFLFEGHGPHHRRLHGTVMSSEDMVDAALVGLDQGELVTLPSLHDGDEWARFEAARRTISAHFFHSEPAPRYRIGEPASA
jgi:hypothetical protein